MGHMGHSTYWTCCKSLEVLLSVARNIGALATQARRCAELTAPSSEQGSAGLGGGGGRSLAAVFLERTDFLQEFTEPGRL